MQNQPTKLIFVLAGLYKLFLADLVPFESYQREVVYNHLVNRFEFVLLVVAEYFLGDVSWNPTHHLYKIAEVVF